MKIHSANMFHSNGHILIIFTILHSTQKYHSYVNFLIADHKKGERGGGQKPAVAHLNVFRILYAKFQLSRFLDY
jgi:hypothetical protein